MPLPLPLPKPKMPKMPKMPMNRMGCPMYPVDRETREMILQWLTDIIGPKKRLTKPKKTIDGKKIYEFQEGGWTFGGNPGSMKHRLDVDCCTSVPKAVNFMRVLDGLDFCLEKVITVQKKKAGGGFVDATPADLDPIRHGKDVVLLQVTLKMNTQAPQDSVNPKPIDVERTVVDGLGPVYASGYLITDNVASEIKDAEILESTRAKSRQEARSANGRTAENADG